MTASRLRLVLNTWTLCSLQETSAFPVGLDAADAVAFIRDAGYEGLQMEADDRLLSAGLAAGMHMSATGRVMSREDAADICRTHGDMGFALTTLHVGTGFEAQAEGLRLIEAVVDASAQSGYPLHVETHRATLTQDPRRTLDLLAAFPELRFNADLSHWYAGVEMPYGDFAAKLDALAPVFARTRYVHGRLADSSCMQVPVGDAKALHMRHFLEMWQRVFSGFLAHTPTGDRICFAPELLPNKAVIGRKRIDVNYARMKDSPNGRIEETDRWQEALLLCDMARQAFAAARQPKDALEGEKQ